MNNQNFKNMNNNLKNSKHSRSSSQKREIKYYYNDVKKNRADEFIKRTLKNVALDNFNSIQSKKDEKIQKTNKIIKIEL